MTARELTLEQEEKVFVLFTKYVEATSNKVGGVMAEIERSDPAVCDEVRELIKTHNSMCRASTAAALR